MASTQFVTVHTLSNRFEADVLLDALKREGIHPILRTFEETAYDGLFVCQRGWGWLMVPQEHAAAALSIIKPLIEAIQKKTLYEDPDEIDPLLWNRLLEADPARICENAKVFFDPELSAYRVPFMGAEFRCSPGKRTIEACAPSSYTRIDFTFCLITLHYLLEAQRREPSGKWIGEKDLPGGEIFFRGPHQLQVSGLVERFGRNTELFEKTAEHFGGQQVDMGDRAYRFQTFPRIPLLVILWKGDEEFDAAVNIRFDSTVNSHLHSLDTIWALASAVAESLLACGSAPG